MVTKTRPWKRFLASICLLLLALVVGLVATEAMLRLFATDEYLVGRPNINRIYTIDSDVLPGIHGDTYYRSNDIGLRADPLTEQHNIRIVAIGGSTTESLALDQEETWTHLIQKKLQDHFKDNDVWVGNAGRSGHHTRHHMFQIEKLLDQIPETDAVIMLVGANDLALRLKRDQDYRPFSDEPADYQREIFERSFSLFPDWDRDLPFYRRSEIWRTLRRAWHVFSVRIFDARNPNIVDGVDRFITRMRERKARAGGIRRTAPDLTTALQDYADNLRTIIDVAQSQGVPIVLLTQPTMWRADLPPDLARLVWDGQIGPDDAESHEFYSLAVLAEAMSAYNATLLAVCAETDVECVDLDSRLPKDATTFF